MVYDITDPATEDVISMVEAASEHEALRNLTAISGSLYTLDEQDGRPCVIRHGKRYFAVHRKRACEHGVPFGQACDECWSARRRVAAMQEP